MGRLSFKHLFALLALSAFAGGTGPDRPPREGQNRPFARGGQRSGLIYPSSARAIPFLPGGDNAQ
jgi:hypothetical protein